MTDGHIALSDAQEVLSKWFFHYDAGDMEVIADLFTEDAHFSCRSDSGESEWEEFVRADLDGREAVMEWQTQHRADSPYPLRHHGSNFHVTGRSEGTLTFASYILVTHVEGVLPVGVSSAVVNGTVRSDGGVLGLSSMELILDMTTSVPFKDRP